MVVLERRRKSAKKRQTTNRQQNVTGVQTYFWQPLALQAKAAACHQAIVGPCCSADVAVSARMLNNSNNIIEIFSHLSNNTEIAAKHKNLEKLFCLKCSKLVWKTESNKKC